VIHNQSGPIVSVIRFIPDHEVEIYFKAADVLVLPYRDIFQSGVLFLAYSFGLPVIATDIGSFKDAIIEGETGFICRACDSSDLARVIGRYFDSDLFRNLEVQRRTIQVHVRSSHSAEAAAALIHSAYARLLVLDKR
jgi:D-inositol-3-phosphate glycosyltransferase